MSSVDGVKILEQHGIKNPKNVHFNLSVPELYEISIKRGEAQIADGGSLVAYTGAHTGRSPKDRFIVKEPTTENFIHWGPVNQPISSEAFDSLYDKVINYFEGKEIFIRDLYACAHPEYRTNVRVINEYAWHNLFVNNLFIRPETSETRNPVEYINSMIVLSLISYLLSM